MLRAVRFSDMPEPKPIDTSGAIPAEEVTWRRILDEEPEVGEVFMALAAIKNKRGRWAIFPKARLAKLVGWHARNQNCARRQPTG